jgi:hypothetical protein
MIGALAGTGFRDDFAALLLIILYKTPLFFVSGRGKPA